MNRVERVAGAVQSALDEAFQDAILDEAELERERQEEIKFLWWCLESALRNATIPESRKTDLGWIQRNFGINNIRETTDRVLDVVERLAQMGEKGTGSHPRF